MPAKPKNNTVKRPKKRAPRGRWRTGQALPKEQFDAVWKLYSKGQSNAAIARATGVSEPTVARCIDKGYPKRGLEPLKERLHRVRRQAMEIADRQATHTRAKVYKQAQQQLANAVLLSMLMMNALDDYRKRTTTRTPDGQVLFNTEDNPKEGTEQYNPVLCAKHIDNLNKATAAVNTWREVLEGMAPWGAADDDREFAGWTTEELEYFAETGELPERLVEELHLEDV